MRAGLLLAALVLAGCASTPVTTPQATTPAGSTTAPASSPVAGAVPEKLKFTATTVGGQAFDGAALAGKPVVFWFWAAWCPKCKGDAAEVRELQKLLSAKVNVVGVAGLASGANGMKTFVSTYQLGGFPQLADDDGVVWKRFAVPSQHYYVILDAAGAEVHRGPLTVAQLKQKTGGL